MVSLDAIFLIWKQRGYFEKAIKNLLKSFLIIVKKRKNPSKFTFEGVLCTQGRNRTGTPEGIGV